MSALMHSPITIISNTITNDQPLVPTLCMFSLCVHGSSIVYVYVAPTKENQTKKKMGILIKYV